MKPRTNRWASILAVLGAVLVAPMLLPDHADAQRFRGGARTAVHRSGGGGRARDVNVHRDVHREVHRDVDVHHHGYGYHGYRHYHPVARAATAAAVVTTAAVATAAIVGTVVATLPPDCETIIVEGYTYEQCGTDYYEPRYSGDEVEYVVVEAPEDG